MSADQQKKPQTPLEQALADLLAEFKGKIGAQADVDRAQWRAVNRIDDAFFWARLLAVDHQITDDALLRLVGLVVNEHRAQLAAIEAEDRKTQDAS